MCIRDRPKLRASASKKLTSARRERANKSPDGGLPQIVPEYRVLPPSAKKVLPVTQEESSEARNGTRFATSSDLPVRRPSRFPWCLGDVQFYVRNECAKRGAINPVCETYVPCAEYPSILDGFVVDNLQPYPPTGGIKVVRVRLSLS